MLDLPQNYLVTLLVHNLLLAGLCWITGVLVIRWEIRVNYTRKLNHFALMLIPFLLAPFLPYSPGPTTITLTLVVFVLTTSVFIQPIRTRFSMVATAFASIDRPEDQPHTLLWIQTQAIASYAVLVGLFFLFRRLEHPELIAIPLIVTGVGDGLAEPVGVRFGRHQYKVPSLAQGRHYVRSLEGSLCVWLVALISIMAFSSSFQGLEWIAAIVLVPLVMTATEAISPHSWDAPFLYLAGGGSLAVVLGWV